MDKLANRIALDALEDHGDARAAWEAVAFCTEKDLPLPDWVTAYLARTAQALLAHLDNRDVEHPVRLKKALGLDRLKKRLPPVDPFTDPHEVYEEINAWVRSGKAKSVADAAKLYSEEVLNGRQPPETVRSWYNSVKKRVTG